jgi:DNA-binding NtrC family response regulator
MKVGVLIIDRTNPFCSNLQSHLETRGYRVVVSDRTPEIAHWVRRRRIDAVLLVLTELRREGLHILEKIRELNPWIQVILINNSRQIALSIEGMKLGAFDDFLMPFDMNELLIRLDAAVQRKKELHRERGSWRRKLDNIMIAVSFAEAGEMETARRYLNRHEKAASEDRKPAGKGDKQTQSNK